MRMLTVLLAALLVALLAACGGGGDGDSDATATAQSTGTPGAASTPVAELKNPAEFLAGFAGQQVTQQACLEGAPDSTVDCGPEGLYKVDPAPPVTTNCSVILAEGDPVALSCTTVEPPTLTYYEIPTE